MSTRQIVTLLSGGMDSATLLYDLATKFPEAGITAVGFDYGQRHGRRELAAAIDIVRAAQIRFSDRIDYQLIDLRSLVGLLDGSALTDSTIDVPEGHYAAENMKSTVVPNRNAMMLSIAASIAIARKADMLAFGAHGGDREIYPDCRETFVEIMNLAIKTGNEGFINPSFVVTAPFVRISKTDIARLGSTLGVPFELTWSCYVGKEKSCGRCGTCVERIEAFELAGVIDPTDYE